MTGPSAAPTLRQPSFMEAVAPERQAIGQAQQAVDALVAERLPLEALLPAQREVIAKQERLRAKLEELDLIGNDIAVYDTVRDGTMRTRGYGVSFLSPAQVDLSELGLLTIQDTGVERDVATFDVRNRAGLFPPGLPHTYRMHVDEEIGFTIYPHLSLFERLSTYGNPFRFE